MKMLRFIFDNACESFSRARGIIELVSFVALLVASFFAPEWLDDVKWPLVVLVGFGLLFLLEIFIASPYRRFADAEADRDHANKRAESLQLELASNAPKLDASVLSFVWSDIPDGRCVVFLQIDIVNSGGSQSVARCFSLKALLNGTQELKGSMQHIADNLVLTDQRGHKILPYPRLYENTIVPIPVGGQAGGWVLSEFEGSMKEIRKKETFLVFEFMDAKSVRHETRACATGDGRQGTIKYHPGAGTPPKPE